MVIDFSVIGLNHAHQLAGYPSGDGEALHRYLDGLCSKNVFGVLAEELNEEGIAQWKGATGSVLRNVARANNRRHIFCDPNARERAALGIPDEDSLIARLGFPKFYSDAQARQLDDCKRKYWPIREVFWVQRVEEAKASRCLFLVGSDHIHSLQKRLDERGHTCRIICAAWDKNLRSMD